MKLWAFHQANGLGNGGPLGYSVFDSTSNSWGPVTQVPGVGMGEAPSAINWSGRIHVFHQGLDGNRFSGGSNGELWFTWTDGTNWAPDTQVQNVGMSQSPSTVALGDKLYVFHQGVSENGQLWYSVFDNTSNSWAPDTQVPGVGMSGSPSAIVWNGRIHVFYQGSSQNGELWFTSTDGTNWAPETQVQNVGMSQSPSTVVWDGKLYVFHQGVPENGMLWYSVFDGASNSWAPDTGVNQDISRSPAATVWNGWIHVFYAPIDLPIDLPDPIHADVQTPTVRAVPEDDPPPFSTSNQIWFEFFDGAKWSNQTYVHPILTLHALSLISTS